MFPWTSSGIELSEEQRAEEEASVEATFPAIESLWAAEVASISSEISALPDNQKGRALAPISRQSIGRELEPENLSEYGKMLFERGRVRIKKEALKPLYP